MAADLIIRIWDENDFGEDVLRVFFHNSVGHKYGSDLFGGSTIGEEKREEKKIREKYGKDPWEIISKTPRYDCGECSMLKACLFDDDSYLYGTEDYISLMKNSPVVIDDDLILRSSFDPDLKKFLKKYKGKMAFSVLW